VFGTKEKEIVVKERSSEITFFEVILPDLLMLFILKQKVA
jgi:hypothetical protein